MFIGVTPVGMIKRIFIRASDVTCVEPFKGTGSVVHWTAGAGVQRIHVVEESEAVAAMVTAIFYPAPVVVVNQAAPERQFKALGAKGPVGT